MKGLIMRSQLITILKEKRVFQRNNILSDRHPRVELREFGKDYPRYPGIETVSLNTEDMSKYIDLTPYMNLTPYIIQYNATGDRVFRLFRTMGLRHLPVINEKSRVVGMITRRDIIKFEEKLRNHPPNTYIDQVPPKKRTSKGNADIELESLIVSEESENGSQLSEINLNNQDDEHVHKDIDIQPNNSESMQELSGLSQNTLSNDEVPLSPRTSTYPLIKVSLQNQEDTSSNSILNHLILQYPSIIWLFANRTTILFCDTSNQEILTDNNFEWPEGVIRVVNIDEIQITADAIELLRRCSIPLSKKNFLGLQRVFENRKKYAYINTQVLGEFLERTSDRLDDLLMNEESVNINGDSSNFLGELSDDQ
jgi:hypothetical protein